MAKDFDDARRKREQQTREERAYILGGQTFYAKASVRPEVLARWNDINEQTQDLSEILGITDEVILSLTENVDNTPERYKAVRESETDIVTLEDLLEVAKWLIEGQTGRPTEVPSASTDSPPSDPKTGTASTGGSSSPGSPEAQAA